MAITRGAKKSHRNSQRKRIFNLRRQDRVTSALKSLKKLAVAGKKKEAMEAMRKVQQVLDKAVKNKTLKKNTAARKKSRLSKLLKKLS